MNKQIQKLAEQAGYLPDMFDIGHWDMPECKKFVQLIVKECLDILEDEDTHDVYGQPVRLAAIRIKRLFGVE